MPEKAERTKLIFLFLAVALSAQEPDVLTLKAEVDYGTSCELRENGRWKFGPGGGLACWTALQMMHDREAGWIEEDWKSRLSAEPVEAMLIRQQKAQQHWTTHIAVDYILAVLAQEMGYRWSCEGVAGMGGAVIVVR